MWINPFKRYKKLKDANLEELEENNEERGSSDTGSSGDNHAAGDVDASGHFVGNDRTAGFGCVLKGSKK